MTGTRLFGLVNLNGVLNVIFFVLLRFLEVGFTRPFKVQVVVQIMFDYVFFQLRILAYLSFQLMPHLDQLILGIRFLR